MAEGGKAIGAILWGRLRDVARSVRQEDRKVRALNEAHRIFDPGAGAMPPAFGAGAGA